MYSHIVRPLSLEARKVKVLQVIKENPGLKRSQLATLCKPDVQESQIQYVTELLVKTGAVYVKEIDGNTTNPRHATTKTFYAMDYIPHPVTPEAKVMQRKYIKSPTKVAVKPSVTDFNIETMKIGEAREIYNKLKEFFTA